ncbi:hypothetical protein CORT_0C06265 [Candida orthopsilosis Co 90-125]|uniref:Uncharacterized protein n=1 Tax=Candida orthopsilosis (strain 90-125) TaxID=1136231 RepID=H8X448_CANO9|nr:hypothetical protein CORT_0C06265 [Candida orthopsilosis Co 90-125]CCG26000.1 hypothetical protein CORT_0C06265 [Candida orthopsilosis Co 90-125]
MGSPSGSNFVLLDYLAALVFIFIGLCVVVKKLDSIVYELQALNGNLAALRR